mmetsp:Transcript_12006/g.38174  ORF Transcript_12006/g.38174 Transcript_12006/m.38174 type:complete len:339 (-) Transcript_12006:70-1086(-)
MSPRSFVFGALILLSFTLITYLEQKEGVRDCEWLVDNANDLVDEAEPGHVSRAHFSTIVYAVSSTNHGSTSLNITQRVSRFVSVVRQNGAIIKAYGSTFHVYTLAHQADEVASALQGHLNMSLDDMGIVVVPEDEDELVATIPLRDLPRDFNKALAPKARLLYAIARNAARHRKSVVFLDADYLIARPQFFRIVLYERIAAFAAVPQMIDLWAGKHLNFLTPLVYNTGFFLWNAADVSLSHMAAEFEQIRTKIWTDQELFSQYIGRLTGMDRESLSFRWNCRGPQDKIEHELAGSFTYDEMIDKYCYGVHQRLDNYTELLLDVQQRFKDVAVEWPPLD